MKIKREILSRDWLPHVWMARTHLSDTFPVRRNYGSGVIKLAVRIWETWTWISMSTHHWVCTRHPWQLIMRTKTPQAVVIKFYLITVVFLVSNFICRTIEILTFTFPNLLKWKYSWLSKRQGKASFLSTFSQKDKGIRTFLKADGYSVFFFIVLSVKPRALYIIGEGFPTELYAHIHFGLEVSVWKWP